MKLGLRITIPIITLLLSSEFFFCGAIVQEIPMVLKDRFKNADIHKNIKGFGPITKQHNMDWLREHGQTVLQTGTSNCVNCHGTDLNGGLAAVSCYRCHNNKWEYPHPTQWISGHSRHVDKHGAADCNECHGTNDEKSVAVSCNDCHGSYADLP